MARKSICNKATAFRSVIVAAVVMGAAFLALADMRVSENWTLTEDTVVDGVLTVDAGVTVSLAGHKLTVGALAGSGTIDNLQYLANGSFENYTFIEGQSGMRFGSWDYDSRSRALQGYTTVSDWYVGEVASRFGISKNNNTWLKASVAPIDGTYAFFFQGTDSGVTQTVSVASSGSYVVTFGYTLRPGEGVAEGRTPNKFGDCAIAVVVDGVRVGFADVGTEVHEWRLARFTADLAAGEHKFLIKLQSPAQKSADNYCATMDAITLEPVAPGELHVNVASGEASGGSVKIAGNVKVVKEGAGTFTCSAASQTWTGGTEVRGGVLKGGSSAKTLFGAAMEVRGVRTSVSGLSTGANLVSNGGFKDGAIDPSSYNNKFWYANNGNYRNPSWNVRPTNKGGITMENNIWLKTGQDEAFGDYSLFMQAAKVQGTTAYEDDVQTWQDLGSLTPGAYAFSFNYSGRQNYTGGTVEARLINLTTGVTNSLASATGLTASYMLADCKCDGVVQISECGQYRLLFAMPRLDNAFSGTNPNDKAVCLDNISFAKLSDGSGRGVVTVADGGTLAVDANAAYSNYRLAFASGATLSVPQSGAANAGSAIGMDLGSTLAFNFTSSTVAPVLTLNLRSSLPTTVNVRLSCSGISRPKRAQDFVLTSGYDFTGKTVNVVDSPSWAKRVTVDGSGNLVLTTNDPGLMVIVR